MKKILILLVFFVSFSSFLDAQVNSRWFTGVGSELPSFNLSGLKLKSQQTFFIAGYDILDNSSFFLTAGLGIAGQSTNDDKSPKPISWGIHSVLGIGGDYLLPIGKRYKLGLEIQGGLSSTDFNENLKNAVPIYYQGGLKMLADNYFSVFGVRQQQFIDKTSFNSTELFFSIGYKINIPKKK